MGSPSINLPDVWECDDANRRANAAFEFSEIEAKTADYTIKDWELTRGRAYSNTGATGAVTITLPPPKAGASLLFFKEVLAQNIVLQMPAGVEVNGGALAGTLTNSATETDVAMVELIAVSAKAYRIGRERGTWATA